MNLSIDVTVNFPALEAHFLHHINHQRTIMTKLDELKTSTDALVAKVEEGNAKTDALILVANTTKDALAALQASLATGTPVTTADLQALIDKQAGAVASITAQEAETDAAATAVAP